MAVRNDCLDLIEQKRSWMGRPGARDDGGGASDSGAAVAPDSSLPVADAALPMVDPTVPTADPLLTTPDPFSDIPWTTTSFDNGTKPPPPAGEPDIVGNIR